ncbi:hypothetical protein GOP47_0003476 [Adiantum capillus-veneris]|uniref:non-specific serine/threonine protein kinase n=1 Tax=Adiantum capillus-veneris TaxID=13818 RepID=A0A9D4VDV8_ADICA|nr:hypothetical protein GOP47_0003476 [Adiantum capillus-veneris]
MGCCSWFDLFFSQDSKHKASRPSISSYPGGSSQEHLLADEAAKQLATESAQECVPPSTQDYVSPYVQEYESPSPPDSDGDKAGHIVKVALKSSLRRVALDPSLRNLSYDNLGLAASNSHHVWRPRHIKFSRCAIRGEDYSGKKMINNYVREGNIGIGSYSKVVLCRNVADEELYAMKIVQKSRLRRIKVAPTETALTDVYKEVSIMKELDHPNIVKLIEVIDDSECDRLYMILEYIEGRCMFEGSGPPGGIGEATARRYFKDVVTGIVYLHSRRIIHGDIKPENLLISASGHVKICDFSVSQRFQGNNDELRRSPGTPVYTAPECITGATYRGRAADVWALGVTLYCMIMGTYPFIGDTLQSTYDEIVHGTLKLPEGLTPQLADLLEGLLCKDPIDRMTLDKVIQHWFYMESP